MEYFKAKRSTEDNPLANSRYFYCKPESVLRNDGIQDMSFDEHQVKVAAFDLDGTLIKTKSSTPFAKDGDDWMMLFESIKPKLVDLAAQGYILAVFTNQKCLTSRAHPFPTPEMIKKIRSIIKHVGVPIQVYAAKQYDKYRKPGTGMFRMLLHDMNRAGLTIAKGSVYVGDAAGRAGDHSSDDKNFARCLSVDFPKTDVTFHVPESFFGEEE